MGYSVIYVRHIRQLCKERGFAMFGSGENSHIVPG